MVQHVLFSMLKASCFKHTLNFRSPSGTSRGVLATKESWFIKLWDTDNEKVVGIGECSLIKGLSLDAVPEFELMLTEICRSIDLLSTDNSIEDLNLLCWPSIAFGLELAFLDLHHKGKKNFDNGFVEGEEISINGLIWMGEKSFMKEQIDEKVEAGFSCIKLKIGAINFDEELSLLKYIRDQYSRDIIEIRVDANGAFSCDEALDKLKRLSEFDLHSIEQPIRPGQYEKMAELCEYSPLAIALDEELIGVFDSNMKMKLLKEIRPHYIVLKPSLHGGFSGADDWISTAEALNVEWWATSALESNIGLNGIAQWLHGYKNKMPQGLGTGHLFTNNIGSPLFVSNGKLGHSSERSWDLSLFNIE